ncbi:hypothetical protein FGU46_10355 [Methanobacterium sp. CWC-01]|uniref:AAA family ATPase n=1 Tax=Methanobacterium aridiramus TaxID=2584467 RepID=UPI002577D6DD|nr:AAA family ATPase [Methanobacterium sp. CWC-01]WJI10461.1 hypothetical protein FGU46_10355 [Methanobacterium sp. CWC-01]
MILKALRIENFRQYLNDEIIFSTDPEKNFTIIQGTNGAGKTNIMNAITWCLYGSELHRRSVGQNTTSAGLGLYHIIKEKEVSPKQSFSVKVEMEFVKEGSPIIIRREKKFLCDKDGVISASRLDGEEFKIMIKVGRDYVTEENPISYIDRTIPQEIEEYFFFDGERLDDYFDIETGKKIKEAVFKIAQIDLFKRLTRHLNERKNDISQQFEDLNPETGLIQFRIRENEQKLKTKKQFLRETEEEIKLAKQNIIRVEKQLRIADSDKVKSLQRERDRLIHEVKELDLKIEEVKQSRLDYLIEMCPKILNYRAIKKTMELAKNSEDEGFIPADYKKRFLKVLIENKKCICGTNLNENDSCLKTLKRVCDETSPLTDIDEFINEEKIRLDEIIESYKNFRNKQKNLSHNIRDLIKNRNEKDKKIKEISLMFKNFDEDEIKDLEEDLQDNIGSKDRAIGRKAVLKSEIEKINSNIEKDEKELAKALSELDEKSELSLILDFSKKALKTADKIQITLVDKIREDIEKRTSEQFSKIMWKEKTYDKVRIDSKYKVSVEHQSGKDAMIDLSAGEGQMLALSFMAALNSVSGFELPIIIDTPLGRLDDAPKLNIAENLPFYLEGKQVTLLVTGTEYSREFRKKLLPRVGKEYKIKYEELEEGGISKVVPYA